MDGLSDHEVERILGYTPCICGVLDGTWHTKCYRGKTQQQVDAGQKSAFRKARAYLKTGAACVAAAAIERSSNGNKK